MPPKKPRSVRGKVKKAKPAAEKVPRAKPVSLYGLDFDDVIRKLVSAPQAKPSR